MMLVRESQSEKAPSPILVTLSGMMMFVRESQSEKARSSIPVTLSGILMLLRDLHSEYLLLVDYQYYTL